MLKCDSELINQTEPLKYKDKDLTPLKSLSGKSMSQSYKGDIVVESKEFGLVLIDRKERMLRKLRKTAQHSVFEF